MLGIPLSRWRSQSEFIMNARNLVLHAANNSFGSARASRISARSSSKYGFRTKGKRNECHLYFVSQFYYKDFGFLKSMEAQHGHIHICDLSCAFFQRYVVEKGIWIPDFAYFHFVQDYAIFFFFVRLAIFDDLLPIAS